jgi:hypothetical protein
MTLSVILNKDVGLKSNIEENKKRENSQDNCSLPDSKVRKLEEKSLIPVKNNTQRFYEAIEQNDVNTLRTLLEQNIIIDNQELVKCLNLCLIKLYQHKDKTILNLFLNHKQYTERMLIRILDFKLTRMKPQKQTFPLESVYKILKHGCNHNNYCLVTFILSNFEVEYPIYQERDFCLDVCQNNKCFQVFLDHPRTCQDCLIYYIDRFIYPLGNNFYFNPCRQYLYHILYLACLHKSTLVLTYLTQNFIIDLMSHPTVNYFDLVQGTNLYVILQNYWNNLIRLKIQNYNENLMKQQPRMISVHDKMESDLIRQFEPYDNTAQL